MWDLSSALDMEHVMNKIKSVQVSKPSGLLSLPFTGKFSGM